MNSEANIMPDQYNSPVDSTNLKTYKKSDSLVQPISQNINTSINCSSKYRIPFTAEEDEKIKMLAAQHGTKNWSLIASFIIGRTSKQCRDRYSNYLVPGFFNGEWSKEEDELIIKLYNQLGPKWSVIKKSFNKRSSNSIKNRWTYFLCKQTKVNDKNNQDEIPQFFSNESDKDYIYEMNEIDNDQNNLIEDIIGNDYFFDIDSYFTDFN